MHKLIFILIFCSLILCPTLKAGDWSTNPAHWGLGFINFDPEGAAAWMPSHDLCFPQGIGFPVYKHPDVLNFAGLLFAETPTDRAQSTLLRFYPYKGNSIPVAEKEHPTEQRRISYENDFLLYVAEQHGFVQILTETFEGGLWIAIKDLKRAGFKPETWQSYLQRKGQDFHMLPPDRFALNLRSQPNASSEKLQPLRGDAFDIRLTGTHKGLWAEVKVVEFTEHECVGGTPTGRQWTGWLKLLDDAGFPNIWYYPGGC